MTPILSMARRREIISQAYQGFAAMTSVALTTLRPPARRRRRTRDRYAPHKPNNFRRATTVGPIGVRNPVAKNPPTNGFRESIGGIGQPKDHQGDTSQQIPLTPLLNAGEPLQAARDQVTSNRFNAEPQRGTGERSPPRHPAPWHTAAVSLAPLTTSRSATIDSRTPRSIGGCFLARPAADGRTEHS